MSTANMPPGTGLKWLEEARTRLADAPGARVVFAHIGALDHSALEQMVAMAEKTSLENRDATNTRKRLVNVLLEGLENLHHHPLDELRGTTMALLVDTASGYRFAMGNALPNATAALLAHRVDVLNEMDQNDLKEHYLKLLSNDARSEHGGAGLGLLTMARKSDRPMIVRTVVMDSAIAYLSLELGVART